MEKSCNYLAVSNLLRARMLWPFPPHSWGSSMSAKASCQCPLFSNALTAAPGFIMSPVVWGVGKCHLCLNVSEVWQGTQRRHVHHGIGFQQKSRRCAPQGTPEEELRKTSTSQRCCWHRVPYALDCTHCPTPKQPHDLVAESGMLNPGHWNWCVGEHA